MTYRHSISCLLVTVSLLACATKGSGTSALHDHKHDDYKGIEFAPCSSDTPMHSICSISPIAVHPTQFALGLRDVEDKKSRIRKIQDDPEAIDYFLRKKIVPTIKGPDSVFYILDGHHTTRALAEQSILVLYVRVIQDCSSLDKPTFLTRLKTEGRLWLFDENGVGAQDPDNIPRRILDLKDDPYRSLAESAQDQGAFDEKPVYFQQFIWANYFRKLVDKSLVESNYKKAVKEAVKWAKDPRASQLPGFRK
jgi:hypothetical protein